MLRNDGKVEKKSSNFKWRKICRGMIQQAGQTQSKMEKKWCKMTKNGQSENKIINKKSA
ncbi:hypothetical protein INT80_01125 [Gallibacterium anatis]|uniref:Uncharacterized protein n=1 Tax=Gallibacterium anatis TaxID=750 RepID=A0A930Y4R2_9PAST|nr:hypothetical protein [Gallibacterium anatis]